MFLEFILNKFSNKDVRALLKLAIPLVISGIVESSIGFFSTIFLSHLGQTELAAGALVAWLFATLMMILWGTLSSVSVLVSQKYGAKDYQGIAFILRDGLLWAFILTIPAFILLWNLAPILLLIGQDPSVVVLSIAYLHGLAWGILPDFVGLVLLQFLIGLGHTRTTMIFTFSWVPLNLLTNYTLMFGKLGMPSLGIAGIGWGTTLAYWISTLGLIVYILFKNTYRRYLGNILVFKKPRFILEILHVGVPMGAMYTIEIGFFLVLTLLMGHLSRQTLAANQIALQYLGQLIAVIFSVAQAVTVRVGHAIGANNIAIAERASYSGIFISALCMSLVALCYWFLPQKLIGIDFRIDDPANAEIVAQATQFLAICALFQLLESIRITLFGALRGLKDSRWTLLASVMSFWCIAFPVGYAWAIKLHFGGKGLWWGMVLGAACSVMVLFFRFQYKIKCYTTHTEKAIVSTY